MAVMLAANSRGMLQIVRYKVEIAHKYVDEENEKKIAIFKTNARSLYQLSSVACKNARREPSSFK